MDNKENFEEKREEITNETKKNDSKTNATSSPVAVKKPIYKKWWFWVVIAVIALAIAIGCSGGGYTVPDDEKEYEGQGDLGEYSVSILDFRLARDYEGKAVIIVKYNFVNNDDENAAFFTAFDDAAYQDGIGLNGCIFVDESDSYSADNQTKEIKPGAGIDVEVAYLLNNETADVEVEVKELFSFSDKVITKTFVIYDGEDKDDEAGEDDQTNNENTKPECNLGMYYVEIMGYRLAEDFEGKPIVIVKYRFTNNDDEAACFAWTFDDNVYQNGVGLNECYFADESCEYSSDNQTKEIKNGSSLEVEVAYELNDSETDIEVEVEELISFKDEVVNKTFSIK